MTLNYTLEQGLEKAADWIGTLYSWGGNSKSKGADCSGFISSWFIEIGHKQSGFRYSADRFWDSYHNGSLAGTKLVKPQAGALVFYGPSDDVEGKNAGHIVLAISDTHHIGANNGGRSTHADNPNARVKIARHDYRLDYLGCFMPTYNWKASADKGTLPFQDGSTPAPTTKTLTVTTGLNLRKAASLSAEVIGVLPSQSKVTDLGKPRVSANGVTWVNISTPLGTGWSSASYLK